MASQKPENRFIGFIHSKLKNVHVEKQNNPFRAGTADVWYSGCSGDLWAEYKFIDRIPKSSSILPNLSPRQQKWLSDRYAEGRNVVVILGTPDGGIIYRDLEWMKPMDSEQLAARLIPKADIAKWIFNQVGCSNAFSKHNHNDVKGRRS